MRFGKRLAAVSLTSKPNEPYISYKELKHIVSRVEALCGGGTNDSSAEEGDLPTEEPSKPSTSSSAPPPTNVSSKIRAPQEEFFQLVDQDVTAAKLYVQSMVSGLEAIIGEWQVAGVQAGLLFTPEQLQEVAGQLPVRLEEDALIEWLISLPPGAKTKAARRALVQKYSNIARVLNSLLHYIEVNLTAVRKIFKKLDKKVPAEFRIPKVRDYKAHHDLLEPAMQHVLVTAVQIQRLVVHATAADEGLEETSIVPISQIGPESLALLSWLKGPASVDDVLGTTPAARIDVYAKPASTAMSGTPAASTGASATATETAAAASSTNVAKVRPPTTGQPVQQFQAGLVTRAEEPEDEEAGAAPSKSRRRGGRANRKNGTGTGTGPGTGSGQVQGQAQGNPVQGQPRQPGPNPQQQPQPPQQRAKGGGGSSGSGSGAAASGKGKGKQRSPGPAEVGPVGPVALSAGLVSPGSSSAADAGNTETGKRPAGQALLLQQQLQSLPPPQQAVHQQQLQQLQQFIQQQQVQLQQNFGFQMPVYYSGQGQGGFAGKAGGKGNNAFDPAAAAAAQMATAMAAGMAVNPMQGSEGVMAMEPTFITAMMPMLMPQSSMGGKVQNADGA